MKPSEEARRREEIRALEQANLEALRRAAERSAQLEAQASERRRRIARLSWIATGAIIAAGLVLYVLFRLLQSL